MPISQVYTDKDRKVAVISKIHNWSYRHQTSMNLNFIESLLNYLKQVYYHHEVIPQLTRSIKHN